MAGGRSFGCRTCKKRRIKCDERKPICWHCEKSGRQCNGPESPFKYEYCGVMVLGRTKQPSKSAENQPKNGFVPEKAPSSLRQISDPQDDSSLVDRQTQRDRDRHMGLTRCPVVTGVPLTDAEILSTAVVTSLDRIPHGFRLRWLGSCFSMIPARIGQNPALDAAADGLSCSLSHLLDPNSHSQEQVFCRYGKALKALRQQLDASQLVATPETLCAALIVSWIEILQQLSENAYIQLSGGVSALVQAWGPGKIKSDFELALFESHLGSLVFNPLLRNTDCFLDTPEWKQVIRKCPGPRSSGNAEVYIAMACLPPLVRKVRQAVTGKKLSSDDLEDLSSRIQTIRFSILRCGPPSEKHPTGLPSTLLADLFAANRSNEDDLHQFETYKRYALYWTAIIIVNRLLQRLGVCDYSLGKQIESARDWIVRFVPLTRAIKPLGCLFMCMAGAVAYGVSSSLNKLLILDAMKEMFMELRMTYSCEVLQLTSDLATGGPLTGIS